MVDTRFGVLKSLSLFAAVFVFGLESNRAAASIHDGLVGIEKQSPKAIFDGLENDQKPRLAGKWTSREHIYRDVFHYMYTIPVGHGPYDQIRLHRVVRETSSGHVQPSPRALMLLHGDLANFSSSFLDNGGEAKNTLATYLARRNIDVWGVDRRWTLPDSEAENFDGFSEMGFAQELDDIGLALRLARFTRGLLDGNWQPLILGGFSRGGQLAYAYAGQESQIPTAFRQAKGLVILDSHYRLGPDHEESRLAACRRRDDAIEAIAQDHYVADNRFFSTLGQLALDNPHAPSPFFPNYTNRSALVDFAGQTYLAGADFSPWFHVAATSFEDNTPVSLRLTKESRFAEAWADSPAWQSNREIAESEAIWCGEDPKSVPSGIKDIDIPLLLIAAAGGFGEITVHSTTLVASDDVEVYMVGDPSPDRVFQTWGHDDLLYARRARKRVWRPMLRWLRKH